MQKKILGVLACVILIIISLLGISFGEAGSTNLKVHFFDVGQGDSILIRTPYEQNIIIDGGPDDTVLEKLGTSLPFYDNKIDLMILTHPHSDHVVGLVGILKRYEVEKILYTGVLHTTDDYLEFLKIIKEKSVSLEIVNNRQDINLGKDLILEILTPSEDYTNKKVENLNNTSIIARLVYKNKSFLFTGDAEAEQEEKILVQGYDLRSDVLKVCHHGSSTSSIKEFLKAVSPEIAVIMCGEDNRFGHPSGRVIKRLERAGVENIFRTDMDGDVVVESDGNTIIFNF